MFFLILSENGFNRLFLIYVSQLLFSFIFLFIAYKILKRNWNRLTLTLSFFYISISIGFILNAVYVPFEINPLVIILVLLSIFFILLGPIFLVLFNVIIFKTEKQYISKLERIYIILYISILILCLLIPQGIKINESTEWRPIFSWLFLIVIYFFITFFILLPLYFLSVKLYKSFEDTNLKKKLRYFFLGIFGLAFTLYGVILYNTWDNPIFRTIWSITTSIVLLASTALIYYAWIHRL